MDKHDHKSEIYICKKQTGSTKVIWEKGGGGGGGGGGEGSFPANEVLTHVAYNWSGRDCNWSSAVFGQVMNACFYDFYGLEIT